jgi:hypothetical protein
MQSTLGRDLHTQSITRERRPVVGVTACYGHLHRYGFWTAILFILENENDVPWQLTRANRRPVRPQLHSENGWRGPSAVKED